MGRASRWLKGFLGMKKDRDSENFVDGANLAASGSFKREKKRWSFSGVKLSRDFDSAAAKAPARVSASDAFWVLDAEEEKQHTKHAMAVAAATAAAADAAVAAAEAAVAVVRLTGKRRGAALVAGGKEARAAVKIQCVFRGFLARKALRALKGLVKIQALVRGYLVRKQAATALSRMQTLIRAQETIRFERARRSLDKENLYPLENQVENNMHESFGVNDELENCPKIVEVDKVRRRSRSHRTIYASFRESSGSEGVPHSSPFSCPMPTRASTPKLGQLRGPDWCFSSYDEFRFKTDQNTPELQKGCPRTPSTRGGWGGIFHPYASAPSYMANTKSFKAKVRSQSAPRHRGETGSKKRVPLSEVLTSRNAMMGGVRMEKSCSNLEEIFE